VSERDLDSAAAALADGDPALSLEHLLEAWRQMPVARLAALIDRVGERADRSRPRELSQRKWLDAAHSAPAADLPVLLRTMIVPTDAKASSERLRAVAERGDPRVSAALVAMLDNPPFLAGVTDDNGVDKFWIVFLNAMVDVGDERAAESPNPALGTR
jgi:hypothetical protein